MALYGHFKNSADIGQVPITTIFLSLGKKLYDSNLEPASKVLSARGYSLDVCLEVYDSKLEYLRSQSKRHDFRLDRCAYVGCEESDLPVMKEVKLPIAFNTEIEEVRKAAKIVVEERDLKKLLKYFPPINIC